MCVPHTGYNRILPSHPQRTAPTAPIRSAAITPTCCLAPLTTWAAPGPVTTARTPNTGRRGRPPPTSLSAATASLSLERPQPEMLLKTLEPPVSVNTPEMVSEDDTSGLAMHLKTHHELDYCVNYCSAEHRPAL